MNLLETLMDSRRVETFKDKDSKDPLIYAGPVWDFDWAYKDHDASMLGGSGWRHDYAGPTDVKPPGWYIRLLQDSSLQMNYLVDTLIKKYNFRYQLPI